MQWLLANRAKIGASFTLNLGPDSYTFAVYPLLCWWTHEYKCFRLVGSEGMMLFLRFGPVCFTMMSERDQPHWRSILDPVNLEAEKAPKPKPAKAT